MGVGCLSAIGAFESPSLSVTLMKLCVSLFGICAVVDVISNPETHICAPLAFSVCIWLD